MSAAAQQVEGSLAVVGYITDRKPVEGERYPQLHSSPEITRYPVAASSRPLVELSQVARKTGMLVARANRRAAAATKCAEDLLARNDALVQDLVRVHMLMDEQARQYQDALTALDRVAARASFGVPVADVLRTLRQARKAAGL